MRLTSDRTAFCDCGQWTGIGRDLDHLADIASAHVNDAASAARGTVRSDPSKQRRREVIARDGRICCWCGMVVAADLSIEHLVGRREGGTNDLTNLRVAHKQCNQRREGDPAAWVRYLDRQRRLRARPPA